MTTQPRESSAARAIAHPVRARVLERLALAPGSPSEVARGLSEPLPVVSYHVRVLNELGFLELLGTIPRRGAIEHRYRATARVRMSIEPLDPAGAGAD